MWANSTRAVSPVERLSPPNIRPSEDVHFGSLRARTIEYDKGQKPKIGVIYGHLHRSNPNYASAVFAQFTFADLPRLVIFSDK